MFHPRDLYKTPDIKLVHHVIAETLNLVRYVTCFFGFCESLCKIFMCNSLFLQHRSLFKLM